VKAYDVTTEDACRLANGYGGRRTWSELRNIIQSMSEKYPDTDNIPKDILWEWITAADSIAYG